MSQTNGIDMQRFMSRVEARTAVDVPIVIVFGRPGAGKTTVANKVISLFLDQSNSVIGLDLDTYVPQWMKDNFGKGIYPTPDQRREFAEGACSKIEQEINERHPLACILSFSFVNTDLRDIFRFRFPCAVWALVSISEEEANKRIAERAGHFYKGAPDAALDSDQEEASKSVNSDWEFAPVDFPHVTLPGNDSIDDNAQRVADVLKTTLLNRC